MYQYQLYAQSPLSTHRPVQSGISSSLNQATPTISPAFSSSSTGANVTLKTTRKIMENIPTNRSAPKILSKYSFAKTWSIFPNPHSRTKHFAIVQRLEPGNHHKIRLNKMYAEHKITKPFNISCGSFGILSVVRRHPLAYIIMKKQTLEIIWLQISRVVKFRCAKNTSHVIAIRPLGRNKAPKNVLTLVALFFAIAMPQAEAAQTVATIGNGPMAQGKVRKVIHPPASTGAVYKLKLQLSPLTVARVADRCQSHPRLAGTHTSCGMRHLKDCATPRTAPALQHGMKCRGFPSHKGSCFCSRCPLSLNKSATHVPG